MMRYIIGFLLAIGLIVLALYLLFHHSGPSSNVTPPVSLTSYADTTTVVQFTIDGPIMYETNHRAIRITVGRDQNTLTVLQGYQGAILNSNIYPNNESAYNVFLHAINIAGFTAKRHTSITDSTGVCPEGNRYYLEVINNGYDIQNLWTTSCSNSVGSFGGSFSTIKQLFQWQIPDYSQQTGTIPIS